MGHLPADRMVVQPRFVQLEDRAVPGKYWTLMHRSSDERFGITDAALSSLRAFEVRRYAAYEEPYLPKAPNLRFIVRGGRVGIEVIELPQGIRDQDNAPITTRVGNERFNLDVRRLTWASPGDVIGYGVLYDG